MPAAHGMMAGSRSAVVLVALAWILWHDVGVYRAPELTRLAGPTYEVTTYPSEADCEGARQVAMAREALPREGPYTESLTDGIKVWDSDRTHYTTFRYMCSPAGSRSMPF